VCLLQAYANGNCLNIHSTLVPNHEVRYNVCGINSSTEALGSKPKLFYGVSIDR